MKMSANNYIADPREREFQMILEYEVDQQLQMEELVRKHAFMSEKDELIVFFTPLTC